MANNFHGSAVPAEAIGIIGSSINLAYNGTTFESLRQNTSQVLMASTSLSASTAISVTNFNGRGIYAYMNVTSGLPPGSASVTIALKIKLIPPNSTASAVTLATTGARSVSGTTVICMYPGLTLGSASGTAITYSGFPVPRDFQVVASMSSGASSVGVVTSIGLHIIV